MKKVIIITSIVAVAATLIFSCTQGDSKLVAAGPISHDSLIKEGEYLVTIMGCHDCHSPMGPDHMPDPNRLLSGHPSDIPVAEFDTSNAKDYVLFRMTGTSVIGPWGASFAANITSDETGIGNWTEEQFRNALTKGKSKGLMEGRDLLPPMPWFNYKNIRDEDLKAIFAYLKSTKPIHNVVTGPIPPNELAEYIVSKNKL